MNGLFFVLRNYLVFLLKIHERKFEWMSLSSVYFFCFQQKYFKTISLTLYQLAVLEEGA